MDIQRPQQNFSPNIIKPSATPNPIQQNRPPKGKTRYFWLLGVLVVILALGFFAFKQYDSAKKSKAELEKIKQGNSNSGQLETAQIVEKAGKLIVLPTDEQPTVATVTDLEKLKDQPFFAQAKVGDKVLIYTKAKKAILYRPTDNKIIEVAPLNIGDAQAANPSSQAAPLTVEIRNGSGRPGADSGIKDTLSANSQFSVVKMANAAAIYEKSVLFVTESKKTSAAAVSLAQISGAEIIAGLPAGEPVAAADAVLIVGK